TQAVKECPQEDPDNRPPGGWGIQLVRRYMDEIRYTREANENVLRLTKHFGLTTEKTDLSHRKPETKHTDMALEIQIQQDIGHEKTGAVTVKLNGSLDTATAPELERQLTPVLAGPVKDLVFDLEQLRFISSAGLRVFSNARKTLKERGGQASFIHMQPQI